jgi:ubiquinone/menaquinone biosynthesis C-methylase UbiE
MLPDLTGKSVVDLGCGYGWFCRAARELGASEVTGVDISEKMLARAAELTADPQIHYQRSDLDALKLDESSLDLVYSSLALHYLPELDTLFARVQRAQARRQPGLFHGAPDLHLRLASGLADRR